jgi:hypothetical protein
MGFDINSAIPVNKGKSKFDISTARPLEQVDQKTIPQRETTLAEKASSILEKPEFSLPLAPLTLAPIAKKVAKIGAIAEKRYPAEELLPPAFGIGGAILSQFLAPAVPFAATAGSGFGGIIGAGLRKGVRELRGKPPDETSVLGEGLKQAAYELGGAVVMRVASRFGITNLARKGIGKLADKIGEIIEPKELKTANTLFDQLKSKPASNASDTKEFIDNFLEKRGLTYKPSAEAIRQRMASETLEPTELAQLAQQMESKAPKIAGELVTEPAKQYEVMGSILDDLSKPDLTYGQLKQIQERVDDLAKFEKDTGRKTVERIWGIVRDKLSQDLKRSATEGGFLPTHEFIMGQRRNIFKTRFLKNVIAESSPSVGIAGEQLDFAKLSRELNKYTPQEISRLFGNDSKYIFALRDLSTEFANRFTKQESIKPFVTATGGVGVTAFPRKLFPKLRSLEKPTRQILQKRLGTEALLPEIIPPKNVLKSATRILMRTPEATLMDKSSLSKELEKYRQSNP